MGRVAVRHARGGAVALLGFAGVVICHLALGLSPLNPPSTARAADATTAEASLDFAEHAQQAQAQQARNFRVAGPVRRGHWTIALGNPYGLSVAGDMCMSVGIVSATGRSLPKLSGKEDRLYSDLIQTTAQINPGNSGGPLFDLRGDVIGINAAVILPQKQTNGIGFAIPTDGRFRDIVQTIKEGREVTYGYLGVRVNTATAREC